MIKNPASDHSPLRPYTDTARDSPLSRPNVVAGSLGAIVRAYKSAVVYRVHTMIQDMRDAPIWQRNY